MLGQVRYETCAQMATDLFELLPMLPMLPWLPMEIQCEGNERDGGNEGLLLAPPKDKLARVAHKVLGDCLHVAPRA